MQAEGGRTIDRRSGTRAATTFRKLPTASAGAKTTTARAKSTSFVSAPSLPELRDESRLTLRGGSSLSAGHLGQLSKRVHRGIAGHPDRDDREAAERRIRGLPEDDGRSVERAIHDRRGSNVYDIRRVDGSLEVRAHELHAVSGRNLAVGRHGAVAVGHPAEEILRRVPVSDRATRACAVTAEVRVLDEHRAGGIDRRLALVPNGAPDVDL